MDPYQFSKNAKLIVDYIVNYHEKMREKTVKPTVEHGFLKSLLPSEAPIEGVEFEEVMNQIESAIEPGMTKWQHPSFFGFYPTGFSFPSLLGSMMALNYGMVGLNWEASPSCTELEMIMLDWLVKALALPKKFLSSFSAEREGHGGGIIISSASESTLMVIMVERNSRINQIKQKNPNLTTGGILDKLRVYTTKHAHNSVERACKMALIEVEFIETNEDEEMDKNKLAKKIQEDLAKSLIPMMVIASTGSTGMCVFDDLDGLGDVCIQYGLKLHVDAAYAGSALVCPEYRYLIKGIKKCNSFCFNAHKLLKTHFDCSILWTDHVTAAKECFDVDAVYLRHGLENELVDLRHWQVALGRSFRSLKLFFVLQMFGVHGLQKEIRHHAELARSFESLIKKDERFEVIYPVKFGLVAFRLKGENQRTLDLLKLIKADKTILLSESYYDKKNMHYIRLSCSAVCRKDDLENVFSLVSKLANDIIT